MAAVLGIAYSTPFRIDWPMAKIIVIGLPLLLMLGLGLVIWHDLSLM
jgi:hypothetical protein